MQSYSSSPKDQTNLSAPPNGRPLDSITLFEQHIGAFVGAPERVLAVRNSASALTLALFMLHIEPGDEVLCPTFATYKSINPLISFGAKPVLIDSESQTWNISPNLLRKAIEERKQITGRLPRAIVVCHAYGVPADMEKITRIAREFGLSVIEDAQGALGAQFAGQYCGTLGDYGILSLSQETPLDLGGTAVLICPSPEARRKALFWATGAHEPAPYEQHEKLGFDFRIEPFLATSGLQKIQTENLSLAIALQQRTHQAYNKALSPIFGLRLLTASPEAEYEPSYLRTCILCDKTLLNFTRSELLLSLQEAGIPAHTLHHPLHRQTAYRHYPFYSSGISEECFDIGLCLSGGCTVTQEQVLSARNVIYRLLTRYSNFKDE